MASERQFNAVPPVLLTADGSTEGVLQVVDTAGLYFGMSCQLQNNTSPSLTVYVKTVVDSTTMYVGPTRGGLDHNVDLSAFTVATASTISAQAQNKASVPNESRLLATYETDPVNAWRTVPVDSYGNHYTKTNPLPVTPFSQFFGSLTLGSLGMPVLFTQCLTDIQYDQVTSTVVGNIETLYFYSDGTLVDTIVITYTSDGWSFQCAGIPGESFLLLEDGGWITLEDNSGFILLE